MSNKTRLIAEGKFCSLRCVIYLNVKQLCYPFKYMTQKWQRKKVGRAS
ncbi:hypothetical protein M948_02840 [Virgibacillus sp. CM-4]|nr:hypothetical protein M948_02840 [Virgibacillus sp. CM-4]